MKLDVKEVERRVDRFKTVAKKSGVKLTHQRIEIFRKVAASTDHPSAESVLKALKPQMPTVSLDTVYRTLWLLNDLGMVSTLGPRRESIRFDANTAAHHHYICSRCGVTRDFESPSFNALRIPKSVSTFGSINATRVEVRGICRACNKSTVRVHRSSKPANRAKMRGARHE